MNFRTASQSAQAGEIMSRAINGQFLTREDTLAIYANEKNWRREYDDKGCKYVWQGPVICAPEAAQRVLERERILV